MNSTQYSEGYTDPLPPPLPMNRDLKELNLHHSGAYNACARVAHGIQNTNETPVLEEPRWKEEPGKGICMHPECDVPFTRPNGFDAHWPSRFTGRRLHLPQTINTPRYTM